MKDQWYYFYENANFTLSFRYSAQQPAENKNGPHACARVWYSLYPNISQNETPKSVMFEVSFLENVSQVRYSDRKNVCYIFFIIQPLMQSRTVTSYIDRLPKLSKLQQKQ